ncbi:transposase [Hymenobacter sp. H14-R3]|uniref:REP-associated tyrosine transposase n=1 Tax=Hymenobacter sp. H14-R3 TaxID=3046308 RepID=UPI0024B88FE4|nr:transposase [Hymenobacter sp. H14-R3]MDJ0364307.1 transposase [Hymenobacter sp. H14-R3]
MKTHYQRRLPHVLPPGAVIFFTFRLAGSLPVAMIQQLAESRNIELQKAANEPVEHQLEIIAKIKKLQFARFDTLLGQANYGPTWVSNPGIARLVTEEILALAELRVVVLAYCLMPNHVHLVVQLPDEADFSASRMMQRLKGRTALAANKLLHCQGQQFWQHESYDHVVRHGKEEERVIAYVLNNPVKAGLVSDWTEWPYSYSCASGIM